ncbi:MAG: hypothetical protein CMH22_05840 [Methylophaga sp.]|nr:hypothetical protein [Methylophaga sp.]|tara:strand:+ start:81424 stop:82383 length:960 start_codon:yes stop_codon:yes gene_type:complete
MKTKQRRLSHEEKNKLFEMYETGNYNYTELCKFFPITSASIGRMLKRNGYKTKSQSELQRKYKINEEFFDEIDTEEKAYVLGLLYADGYNNTDRNSVKIVLKNSDRNILDRIKNLIQPSKKLYLYKNETSYGNSDICHLDITNKHISERLVELGCGKAKTHTLTFPTEDQVPKHLQRHFIRGYFDGDGSVSGNKQKQFSIVGTINFLLPLQEILMEELNFSKTKLDDRHNKEDEIRSLRYCGINQCIKFRDWLYEDSTIFLKRKKEIFDSYSPFERQERKCSVEGCDKKHSSKGYCRNHYYEFCGGKEKRRKRFKETGK